MLNLIINVETRPNYPLNFSYTDEQHWLLRAYNSQVTDEHGRDTGLKSEKNNNW